MPQVSRTLGSISPGKQCNGVRLHIHTSHCQSHNCPNTLLSLTALKMPLGLHRPTGGQGSCRSRDQVVTTAAAAAASQHYSVPLQCRKQIRVYNKCWR
uniref:Uncharacterized protein n=1 Tax=Anguilla anguilla TaxID=7936 RepID=A0A0E9X1Y5_ANGAN